MVVQYSGDKIHILPSPIRMESALEIAKYTCLLQLLTDKSFRLPEALIC